MIQCFLTHHPLCPPIGNPLTEERTVAGRETKSDEEGALDDTEVDNRWVKSSYSTNLMKQSPCSDAAPTLGPISSL